jgi:ribonuclease-3
MDTDLSDIEEKIGYRFHDGALLVQALTHASSIGDREGQANERLEFIGDAVIDLAVAQMLYESHPLKDEGWLSQMRSGFVDEDSLAEKARGLGLGSHMLFGKGEEAAGGQHKPSILAGVYEALIGAIFLDGGYDVCREILGRNFQEIGNLTDTTYARNFKSLLQERLQKEGKDLPRYEVVEASGPDHDRVFVVAVLIGGLEWGRGSGKSKKDAEQEAARRALEK